MPFENVCILKSIDLLSNININIASCGTLCCPHDEIYEGGQSTDNENTLINYSSICKNIVYCNK